MQLMDRLGLRTFSPPAPPLDNQDPAPKLRRLTQIGKRAKVKNRSKQFWFKCYCCNHFILTNVGLSFSGAVSALKMCLSSWETSHVLWKLDGIMSTLCLEDPFWSTPGAALLDATTVKTFLERTCYVQVTFLRKFPTGAFSLILSIIVRVFVSVHQRPDGHQAEVPDWSRPRLGFFAISPLLC